MTTFKPTFDVDKIGLQKILSRRGIEYAVLELIQNALDEDTRTVTVSLRPVPGTRRYKIEVEDDNPDGFKDLAHAYTLFAESEKKANPEQRGRFNLGEKLVIAACEVAAIETTKGTVEFDAKGRYHYPRRQRESGSVFLGEIKMTKDEAARVEKAVRSIIIPDKITLYFNGERLEHRFPVGAGNPTLPTERADEEGYLRPTRRMTIVGIYEPREGETPMLYEMGLPVVETGDRWHINIGQKVPLNMDRDNVTPAYLREVRTFVLNTMAEKLEKDASAETWVTSALTSDDIEAEAVEQVLTKRYGEKRVIFDPSDPEANKLAVSKGYTVISGRSLPSQAWKNVKRFDAALPAGRVTPSPKPYNPNADGPVRQTLPKDKWTDGVKDVAKFARWLGRELMDVDITVEIVSDPRCMNFGATYAKGGFLEFNWRTLGRAWFEQPPYSEEVLRLIIHEFGHQYESDHLSSRYHDALCRLGARLAIVAMKHPSRFQGKLTPSSASD